MLVLFVVIVSINNLSPQDTTKVESRSEIKNQIEDGYIRIPKKEMSGHTSPKGVRLISKGGSPLLIDDCFLKP